MIIVVIARNCNNDEWSCHRRVASGRRRRAAAAGGGTRLSTDVVRLRPGGSCLAPIPSVQGRHPRSADMPPRSEAGRVRTPRHAPDPTGRDITDPTGIWPARPPCRAPRTVRPISQVSVSRGSETGRVQLGRDRGRKPRAWARTPRTSRTSRTPERPERRGRARPAGRGQAALTRSRPSPPRGSASARPAWRPPAAPGGGSPGPRPPSRAPPRWDPGSGRPRARAPGRA